MSDENIKRSVELTMLKHSSRSLPDRHTSNNSSARSSGSALNVSESVSKFIQTSAKTDMTMK